MSVSANTNKFVKYGLPMAILMVAGSFGLRELQELKLHFRDEKARTMSKEEVEKLKGSKRKFNMQDELQRLEQMDIDNWENKRVPRPGESTRDL